MIPWFFRISQANKTQIIKFSSSTLTISKLYQPVLNNLQTTAYQHQFYCGFLQQTFHGFVIHVKPCADHSYMTGLYISTYVSASNRQTEHRKKKNLIPNLCCFVYFKCKPFKADTALFHILCVNTASNKLKPI